MKRFFSGLYSVLIFVFLYAPIVVLIVYSFNDSKSRAVWGGFTLRWYRSLLDNGEIMRALGTTISIALLAATIGTIIGTISAIGIFSMRGWFKKFIYNLTYLPMLNPDIVTGISLLILFVIARISLGYVSLLLAHISFCIPYVIVSVLPKLKQMSPHVYEAALDLGAKPMYAIVRIVLPEIMPGVITGFLMSLTLSIDDFVISFFTTGPGVNTLSITIYNMARRGIKPEINALSTLLFLTVLALLLIVNARTSDSRAEPRRGGGSHA